MFRVGTYTGVLEEKFTSLSTAEIVAEALATESGMWHGVWDAEGHCVAEFDPFTRKVS